MPLNIDITQILLHMLNFVILAGGLTFLLYKPVQKFLNERKELFARQARENEEQAKKNESLKAEYEQKIRDAQTEIAALKQKAEEEAVQSAKTYLEEAKEKASWLIATAEEEAEVRRGHILEAAQTEIGEMVIEAAQKLLNEQATPERSQALYDEFIACVGADAGTKGTSHE